MRLLFLGTGAAQEPPGRGRSGRLEARLISKRTAVLIDVTRHFAVQAERLGSLDAVLITHGHRDAIGGLPRSAAGGYSVTTTAPIDVYLSGATAEIIATRYRRLDHCRLHLLATHRSRRVGALTITAIAVPHARDPRFTTYAWRVSDGTRSLVYASDVAHLTRELERFCAGANVLVLDGAMWRKRLFSHLTIDESLPTACSWPIDSIILTQIGRTAPPHAQLQHRVAALCPKALAAHDGLAVTI